MGNLIQISSSPELFRVGNFQRKALTCDGCNEPFKGYFWCPLNGWFNKQPCCHEDKWACKNWEDQCYGKTY